MNHQIYGVILFAFILILIYLLNRINFNEGFENNIESIYIDNFNIYDNVYFDTNKEIKNISFDNALLKCMNDTQCLGITKDKTKDIFYEINNIGICKTSYQGSDLEKDRSKNYITYIKKSIDNNMLSCITDDTMNKIISIQTSDLKVWVVKNNKIELSSIAKVDVNNEFNLTKFKLVKGLSGFNTVSIKFEISGFPDTYVINEYPKKAYLSLKEITGNQEDLKKSASFKIVNGLDKQGFSIKIIGFPNMFITGMNIGENKNIIGVSMVENEDMINASFYIKDELSTDYIKNNNLESSKPNENLDDIADFSVQEKIKKMRTKNLYNLDKQSNLLDNQTNIINNYNFIHKNNIGDISREFANQSANLALSKYLEEKNEIDRIKNLSQSQSQSQSQMVDNTPSNRRI
jgi:hypothetical protein